VLLTAVRVRLISVSGTVSVVTVDIGTFRTVV
jgi:hypothetical protein